jgi:hypothetical protein
MSNVDELYPVWEKAEAFKVSGLVYSNFFVSYPSDYNDEMLSMSTLNDRFELFEVFVDKEQVEDGEIVDDVYTLKVKDDGGDYFTITPLFLAGTSRRSKV